MHNNFKTHRRVKAVVEGEEKFRMSLLDKSNQQFIKEVRNSLETPLTFLVNIAQETQKQSSSAKKCSDDFNPCKQQITTTKGRSSLLTTISFLTSKIHDAKSLLIVREPNEQLTKKLTRPQPESMSKRRDVHSYFNKRENTSLSTINLESQKHLGIRSQPRQKIVWAANLKLYYVGHIARGVMGVNERAYEHIYETHQILATNSFSPPKAYTPLNLPCNPADRSKKVLVVDLDETLIHYHFESEGNGQIEVEIEEGQKGYVAIRPYALSFLKKMSKYFEIIVFTASQQSYADVVLDEFDIEGLIKHRLYREHCLKLDHNLYAKDLRVINRDLSQIVLVDNSAVSFICQPENGIPILPFTGGEDRELLQLEKYLLTLVKQQDVRQLNREVFKLERYASFEDCQELVNELYYGQRKNYY